MYTCTKPTAHLVQRRRLDERLYIMRSKNSPPTSESEDEQSDEDEPDDEVREGCGLQAMALHRHCSLISKSRFGAVLFHGASASVKMR